MARTYIKAQAEQPYPHPETEREELQNILWGIGVAIPGSSIVDPHSPFYLEMTELRDLVQWQMDKVANEEPFRKGHITDDAREGYRQYLRWRDRRNMGVTSYSVPGIPNA